MNNEEQPVKPIEPVEIDLEFEKTLNRERLELLTSRTKFMMLVGGGFYSIFWALDWVTVHERIMEFLTIRACVAVLLLIGYLLMRTRYSLKLASLLSVGMTLLTIFGVGIMTALLGGFTSFYYIGIIFILFVTGMFFPWTLKEAVVCGVLSVGSYVAINLFFHGNETHLFTMLQPVFFMSGAVGITAFAGVSEERTRRHGLEMRIQIEKANEELQELDKAKMRFFANVSHELRSPLTLILGPLEAILRGDPDERLKQLLEAMEANARRLLRQVNSLLDFAKIDAGKLECKYVYANLGKILHDLALSAKPHLSNRNIELVLEGLDVISDSILDGDKIDTIAANLMSNAIKFTPDGGRLTIRTGEHEEIVWFEVEDTGEGIPEDQLQLIFERFLQVEDGSDRRREGTGLGLAMVKELTKIHRGKVTVRSKVGEGTAFRVEIPKRPDSIPLERRRMIGRRLEDQMAHTRTVSMLGAAYEEKSEGRKKTLFSDVIGASLKDNSMIAQTMEGAAPPDADKVLVVDDNPDLRTFIANTLTDTYQVQMAQNGVEGLATARRWSPDLIISDIMMPLMDGFELTRQIRQDAALSQVPVILATSKSGGEAVAEGLEVGANDYLAKPFEIRELQARVAAQLRARRLERNLSERESRLAAIGRMTSAIVHDLRNPLTAIIGFSEIASQDAQSEDSREMVSKDLEPVISEANRLSRMISEVLDFARGQSSDLNLVPTELVAYVETVCKPMKQKLGAMSIELQLVHKAGRELQVNLDNDRMLRVLENLVKNAQEAMWGDGRVPKDKHIWITTDTVDDRSALIRIADDGPGIPEALASTLFDAFTTSNKPAGTGLGLATVRNLVIAHGGTIKVEPKAAEGGAAFIIKLPRINLES
ncbi:MAG: ATP-binding protein [Candidatus Alcyoniella australis]|nr:ATP-binding protein [Candidatus Alcyoniella australis]